jgi:hypothetical protein
VRTPLTTEVRWYRVGLAIKESDFEAVMSGDSLVLRGNANGRNAERLEYLISQVHTDLIGRQAMAFDVDMRGLEFMTAACFNVFVTWVNLIAALPGGQRYQLRFAIDDAVGWQRRSLVTLSSLGSDIVTFGN